MGTDLDKLDAIVEAVGVKPYYRDEAVVIYHADCRDVWPRLRQADAVITDPPYANDTDYGPYRDGRYSLELLRGWLFDECRPLVRRMAVTCGVANLHDYPRPDWILSWMTPAGVGSGPWGFCCWQPIPVYGADPYLKTGKGRRPDSIVLTEQSEPNGHPCPKPIGFMRWLVERVSLPGETILDPFMGSGTTLRAAKDLGRYAVGIEIEEKYCEIAAKRMAQMVMPLETETPSQGALVAKRAKRNKGA